MSGKIRVGAVSYLNTKPLIYGFQQGLMKDEVELVIDYPSKIAAALLNNEIDIGLVPVAILPELKSYQIIGNYGIGSDGDVASVCIFSEVPMEQIETVLLDYQSRTSVKLAQILMKNFWKITPVLKNAGDEFRSEIKGTTAAVVIGDRAFEQRLISPFIYDLGKAWKEYTSKSFIFAVWVSNKPIAKDFIEKFNQANAVGLSHLDEIIHEADYKIYDLNTYYKKNIQYQLDDSYKESIDIFLKNLPIDQP